MYTKIVITGGAGFIGSHIVDHFVQHYPGADIVVFDKMTYAADIRNIIHHIEAQKITLVVGDVANPTRCLSVLEGADLLIHAAAESHVDNSFGNSLEFTKTNVLGTHTLMEAALRQQVKKIVHVSTDEVYGEVKEGRVDESGALLPTNPYSASKAAADMMIRAYRQSFELPVVVVRSNNIFGVRQFPEKIIPKFIMQMLKGQALTIHGSGENRRHYLAAEDLVGAIDILARDGQVGEIYNIGTTDEYKNIEIARMICSAFGVTEDDVLTFIDDRPFNDARYAITWDPLSRLGWAPKTKLEDQLPHMIEWYTRHFDRFAEKGASLMREPQI